MSNKLDRIIDGIRYRSSTRIDPDPVRRSQYVHGVRDVALWLCRSVVVVERDSQWDRGDGACRGRIYQVLDPRDDDGRMMIQDFADAWQGYAGELGDEYELLCAFARRHAPSETDGKEAV